MKMQDRKLKQFKVYKIIAQVLFIIVIVAGAIGIASALAVESTLALRGVDIAETIQNTFGSYFPDGIALTPGMIPHGLIFTFIAQMTIAVALAAFLLHSTSKLFGNIYSTKTPFSNVNYRLLRSMGIAFFIYAGVELVVGAVAGGIVAATVPTLIGTLRDTNVGINLDLAPIMFGLLLMALAQIFDYGASLQNDSESIV